MCHHTSSSNRTMYFSSLQASIAAQEDFIFVFKESIHFLSVLPTNSPFDMNMHEIMSNLILSIFFLSCIAQVMISFCSTLQIEASPCLSQPITHKSSPLFRRRNISKNLVKMALKYICKSCVARNHLFL